MAPPTPQGIELESAFRQFAGRSDPITQYKTATFFFPAEQEWQRPVDILPADELEIKLPLIEAFFARSERLYNNGFPDIPWTPPGPQWIAAMLQFDRVELQNMVDSPRLNREVFFALPVVGPLIKRCLAKRVRAKEAEAARSALSSRASSISRQDSKRRATSASVNTSGKRLRVASEDDDDLAEEDVVGGNDRDDHDYRSRSPRIKAGEALRNRKEKAKRLELDGFRCLVCGTDSPTVCHVVPFCVNNNNKDIKKWRAWLTDAVVFLNEPSKEIHDDLLEQSFTGSQLGLSDQQWNMVCLNQQLHTWWGQARWGFKCLGLTTGGPAPEVGYTTLKLQFHWMPRRATDSNVATLSLNLTDFLSAFDGNYGDPTRKPLICMTYPGTGRFIETGDIFYVKVPTSDSRKMELAFQIQWAVLKIAATAGGAEALDYLPDSPEDDENGQYYALVREQWVRHYDAVAALGSSAQHHATDDTKPTSHVSSLD